MKKILENSWLFRLLTAFAGWIDRQWQKSFLALALQGSGQCREGGLLSSACRAVHRWTCRAFRALGLRRLTEGSIWTREKLWLGLTVFFTPLLPTALVLALALAAALSVGLGFARDEDRRAVRSPLTKWVAAFALVYAVSGAFTLTRDGNVRGTLMTLVFSCFCLALLNVRLSLRDVKRLVCLMAASGALVAAYGIWQAVVGAQSSDKWIDERLFGNISIRVYSTLDNPNILSEYLLLVLPLGVASVFTARTPNGKAAAATAVAAMVLCMFLTWSRAGWVGLFLSAAVFLVLLDRRFLLPGLAGLAAVVALMPQGYLDRLMSLGSMADSSAFYRVSIWTGAVKMLGDCWLSGVGPGAFTLIYPQYSLNAAIATHAHNLYLQLMCDSGVLGILTFLGLVGSTVRLASGAMSRGAERERRIYLIAILAGLAGFLLQSVAEYSFYNYRVMLTFFTVLGLAASLSRRETEARP